MSYIAKNSGALIIERPDPTPFEYYKTTDGHWTEGAIFVLCDGEQLVLHDPPSDRWLAITAPPWLLSSDRPVWPWLRRVLREIGIVAGQGGRAAI